MNEKFWDILAFTQQVSRLMVSEIRRRASNQSIETASCAIVKFLEIENSEESSNGWMLLSALNLLAAGDASLIQAMTAASVPSTLVKCLYLFLDLPEMNEEEADITDANSEFTPRERRILLQKIFVQVIIYTKFFASFFFSIKNRLFNIILFLHLVISAFMQSSISCRRTCS